MLETQLGKRLLDALSASASPPERPTVDAKVRRVVHVLENLTRTGETFASGSCAQFPLPGLSFHGAQEHELQPPLRQDDVQKIKERDNVTQRRVNGTTSAWVVDGELLNARNPRWHTFLDDCLARQRKTLGIAATSTVHTKLQKLLWVEAGGRLDCGRQHEETRDDRVFGRLVVVLPSAFEGGDIVVQRVEKQEKGEVDDEDEDESDDDRSMPEPEPTESDETICVEDHKIVWRPGARSNSYDLVYAVIFDNCADPSDVPLFAGPIVEQQAVNTALSQFFSAAPDTVTKRFKISQDARRTINNFAVDRHFVYQVNSSRFTALTGVERQVAASLAALCAQSGGQYTLYLAELMFSEDLGDPALDGGYNPEDVIEVFATLKALWLKYGDTEGEDYAPIMLRDTNEIAPMGSTVDYPEFPIVHTPYDASLKRIFKQIHGEIKYVHAYRTYALVVQPNTIGVGQSVRHPVQTLVTRLQEVRAKSDPEEAMQLARRIIFYNQPWRFDKEDMKGFAAFVKILIDMNDRHLFHEFLRALGLVVVDTTVLQSAIRHFGGWEACLSSAERGVLSTPTLRGRINLIRSVANKSMGVERFDRLIHALISLPPWSEASNDAHDSLRLLLHDEFDKFLTLVNKLSPQRLVDVVAVKHPKVMTMSVGPAALRLKKKGQDGPIHRAMVRRVWELYKPMLPELKNDPYASIYIRPHCRVCKELQAWLKTTETEATIECSSQQQREHLAQVIRDSNYRETDISYRYERQGFGLRVDKSRASESAGIHNDASSLEERLRERIRAIDRSAIV